MARRSKQRSGAAQKAPVDEETLIRKGASVKAIRTLDDVEQESADEFDAAKDKVLLGIGRGGTTADDGESDEEVFGVRGAEDSSDDDGEASGSEEFYSDDEGAERTEDGAWGKQKHSYYDADDIGTDSDDDEAAAKEEGEEALRLQKKRLEALDEADFMDEFGAELGVDTRAGGAARLVGVADDSQAQISLDGAYDMTDAKRQALLRLSDEEKLRVIQAETPELLTLAEEMRTYWQAVRDEIKPILEQAAELGVRADDHPALAFHTARYQLVMGYVNNIAVYLVAKASTPDERGGLELRDHPVIGSIVEFRRRLEVMDALQERLRPLLELFGEELASGSIATAAADSNGGSEKAPAKDDADVEMADARQAPAAPLAERKAKARSARRDRKAGAFLAAVAPAADSYSELQASLRKSRKSRGRQTMGWDALEDGDLGEQERMDEGDAQDKARAIRRLRNHAKRIVQARGKRNARDRLAGDADVPYKERNAGRLRHDDTTAAAVRAQTENYGDDLGMDLDSDGPGGDRDGDYYTEIVQRKEQGKADKEARRQAHWAQMVAANEAEEAAVEGSTKRGVNYQILKNKGLLPRRTKEQRNPRVKRRQRYEKAKKKLSSSAAQVRAQEGNYGGEATGIKSNLTRSTHFG
ncbi:something about silencing protein 10 [Coemansia sp. RSA 552]|nr:something about silencing protein 10 [Coemansia sp. RSA 552]